MSAEAKNKDGIEYLKKDHQEIKVPRRSKIFSNSLLFAQRLFEECAKAQGEEQHKAIEVRQPILCP